MKLDVYQCPVCFYAETEPAGQVRAFLDKCPRCMAANMEKTETCINGGEYDKGTKEKMKRLKNKIWRFV